MSPLVWMRIGLAVAAVLAFAWVAHRIEVSYELAEQLETARADIEALDADNTRLHAELAAAEQAVLDAQARKTEIRWRVERVREEVRHDETPGCEEFLRTDLAVVCPVAIGRLRSLYAQAAAAGDLAAREPDGADAGAANGGHNGR